MSRIAPVNPAEAAPRAKEVLGLVNGTFGRIPNGVRVLANSPVALAAWWSFEGILGTGALPRSVHEQLAVLTADTNGCGYCLSAHTAAARGAGVSAADAAAARDAKASDPLAAAVLEFGAAVLAERGDVADEILQGARQAGLSDGDLLEIVAVVALNTFTNYCNRLARTELDVPDVRVERRTASARPCCDPGVSPITGDK
jgi:uncharacterized peroxidase-related enzyme